MSKRSVINIWVYTMDLLQCCVFQLKQCHQCINKTRKHNFKLYCSTRLRARARARARAHTHTHTHTHTLARSLTQSLTLTHACTHAYTHNQRWGRCRHQQHSISVNTLTLSATCYTYTSVQWPLLLTRVLGHQGHACLSSDGASCRHQTP